MKANIFFILALMAFGSTNAQNREKGTIKITPKIEYSSFIEHNDKNYNDRNTGLELSVIADYYFNRTWSLRSGLIFDKMGGQNNSLDLSHKFEDKLNYLSILLNANWHFSIEKKWNLNLGLSASILIFSKYKEYDVTNNIPKDLIKPFQLGLIYGIGYTFEITEKFGVLVDTQFFKGLTNVSNTPSFNYTNSGYSFSLGGVIQL